MPSGTMSSISSPSVVLDELCRCGEPGMLIGCVLILLLLCCCEAACCAFLSPPTTESELDLCRSCGVGCGLLCEDEEPLRERGSLSEPTS